MMDGGDVVQKNSVGAEVVKVWIALSGPLPDDWHSVVDQREAKVYSRSKRQQRADTRVMNCLQVRATPSLNSVSPRAILAL